MAGNFPKLILDTQSQRNRENTKNKCKQNKQIDNYALHMTHRQYHSTKKV